VPTRALTGEQGEALERLIEPFVFRKYLDYDAYGGLRDVHRQIRGQGRRRDYASNIKLGPGGIREIEFIAQALQLVRGGREPALRPRGTLPALAALAARGLLPSAAVAELDDAYVFLRNVEHRLQYRDDAQTHELPADAESRSALARACGFADGNTGGRQWCRICPDPTPARRDVRTSGHAGMDSGHERGGAAGRAELDYRA